MPALPKFMSPVRVRFEPLGGHFEDTPVPQLYLNKPDDPRLVTLGTTARPKVPDALPGDPVELAVQTADDGTVAVSANGRELVVPFDTEIGGGTARVYLRELDGWTFDEACLEVT